MHLPHSVVYRLALCMYEANIVQSRIDKSLLQLMSFALKRPIPVSGCVRARETTQMNSRISHLSEWKFFLVAVALVFKPICLQHFKPLYCERLAAVFNGRRCAAKMYNFKFVLHFVEHFFPFNAAAWEPPRPNTIFFFLQKKKKKIYPSIEFFPGHSRNSSHCERLDIYCVCKCNRNR